MPDSVVNIDTVVIGAGQAGLAAAYYLRQHGQQFVVLDERPAVGHVWATRFESLRLFSPAWASGLPGLPWPGNARRYPTKDEAAAYLQLYAEHFELPVRLGQRVTRVAAAETGQGYEVRTATGPNYVARNVIVCTGPYNAARLPKFAPQLASTVPQLHSSAYQRAAQLPGTGPVAVVGSGNSALQIGANVAATGRPVYAAYNEQTPSLPNHTGMWLFLKSTGLMRVPRHSWLGRRMLGRPDPVVSADLSQLRSFANVHFVGPAVGVTPDGHGLQGTTAATPPLQAVVWATGYGPAFDWIQVPIVDAAGEPLHQRGLTAAPGLAFLGLPWLHTRSSALMGGAGADARYVVEALVKRT